MIRRLSLLCAVSVAIAASAASSAWSFTLENDPAKLPKFDFDEQLRQFRSTPQLEASGDPKKGYQTPFGTLQLGVTRNNAPYLSPFGSSLGSQFNSSGNADRKHFDRMFAPPHRQHEYD